jgi:beta-phosphoglucomutase-like phosphatase (HAD superfamily)
MLSTRLAVIFDMDGVLLDTERIGMRAWMAAATAEGLDFSEELYRGMIGLSHTGTKAYLRSRSWSEPAIERVFNSAWAIYTECLERDGIPTKAGLCELLDFLDLHGISRAVATSTATALASRHLEKASVLTRLDALVGGEQVKHGKPAPDIFLQAAKCLGRPPQECVVVEDSQPGICAAAAAGMKVIWVPDLSEIDSPTRALIFAVAPSLLHARDVIRSLAA